LVNHENKLIFKGEDGVDRLVQQLKMLLLENRLLEISN
jgi:hypothetical protein